MHKDDQMTPRERAIALSRGERVDRMPISMFYFSPSHRLLGVSSRECFSTGRKYADIQTKVYETFGCDGVTAKYGLHSMGIAFGAKMTDPEFGNRAIVEHPIKDIRDLSMLDLERMNVKKDINAKRCYEAAQILLDEIGDEVGCGFGATGCFSCATSLLGPERLMRALYKYPEQLHELLDFATKAMIQIAQPFVEMGCGISVSEPMASGTILSKKCYDEFVKPYSKRFVEACKAIKPVKITIHICGDTTALLESIAECGYDTVSIDNIVDLEEAKRRIGDCVCLMGNVDPVDVLYAGTPESVKRNVRRCYKKGWDNPRGYMICTGCDTPMNTPFENSFAYMGEARRCARYPINPANFE